MAPIRQVSNRQLEILVEFAEANRVIVNGGMGKSPLGQQQANRAWEKVARRLNSVGTGLIKTPLYWKRYWHLLKCRTKSKAADIRRSMETPGGSNKLICLSTLEQRIVAVVDKETLEGIAKDRIRYGEPVETDIPCSSARSTGGQSSASVPSPASPPEVEYLEVDMTQEVVDLECLKEEPECSLSEQPSEPCAAPASSAAEPLPSAATAQSKQPPDHDYAPTSSAARPRSQDSCRSSRPRKYREPACCTSGWAFKLVERRMAVEERLVEEVAGLGAANRAILRCLQQLVQLLQVRRPAQ